MKAFSDISFYFEAKIIPIGMVRSILSWLSMPLVIIIAGKAFIAGNIHAVDYLIISFLPLFLSKLSDTIFVDLTSYKNLMIAKRQILKVANEKEDISSNTLFEGELISVIVNLNAITTNDFNKSQLKRLVFETRNTLEFMLDSYKDEQFKTNEALKESKD